MRKTCWRQFGQLPWLLLLPILVAAVTLPGGASQPATSGTSSVVGANVPAVVISLHGKVDDFRRDSLIKAFAKARQLGAKTIILDLDTPGGLVTSGLDLTRFLRRQDDLHVIAYVSNKAYSAGTMIAVACNEIVMAPDAVIGDCAPIMLDASDNLSPLPATERAKVQSPILADFDASAERNGYDRRLLEAMVVVDRSMHYLQSPGDERKFASDDEAKKLLGDGWKPVPGVREPLNDSASLLTLPTSLASKIGLCKQVANSAQALADSRGCTILADLSPGNGEAFIELLASPALRGLLLTVFLSTLYISLNAPGHGAAEAIATLSLGLLLGIPLLTGYAQWWELVAIFVGLGLIAFEIFVFPGHFVSAIAGILLMLFGLLLTFVGREPGPGVIPSLNQTWQSLWQGLVVITAALACSMLLSMWLRKFLPHIPYFNKLILNTTSGGTSQTDTQIDPANLWPGVGTEGQAVTPLLPGGSAEFYDASVAGNRPVAVISEAGYIPAGTRVVVRESRGNRVVVRAVS